MTADPTVPPLTHDELYGTPGTGRDSTGTRLSSNGTHADQGFHSVRDKGDTRDKGRTSWTAAELLATDFPAPRWAVPGLVAEGVTVFAGAPKAGKSWLALGLGVAVSSGGKALGRIDVDEGPVLALCLEDTPRRLKSRLEKILGPDPAPTALTIAVECPPLPMGGDERIADWLARNSDARLVIIDVFARVRGPALREMSAYDADYLAVARAKVLADQYGVAFLIVHHTRKATDEDWLNTVSGTQGVSGASDAIAVLKRTRGKADGLLSITGRDVEEAEHALVFDPDLGAWRLSDMPAALVKLTDTQRVILEHLAGSDDGATPKAIADATGLDYELVKKSVRRMVPQGDVITDGHGNYWAPVSRVPHVPAVPAPGQSTCSPVPDLSPDVPETQQGDQP